MFLIILPVYSVLLHLSKVALCNFYLEDDGSTIMERIFPANNTTMDHRSQCFETWSNPYWAFLLAVTIIMHGIIGLDILKDKYPQLNPVTMINKIKSRMISNTVAPQSPESVNGM